ncbi:MAG: RNA polymerase sigma factor [Elusimicrobia bacterium]|nr:RNA polymerase sigma factor [Candidatus Obscuribacterium magneticum]
MPTYKRDGKLMEDFEIINEILSGNQDAYGILVRRYHLKVMGFCLSILKNRTESDDAAQEIFLKAFKGLASFQGESAFSTWLYRIAYNHCMNVQKSRQRHRLESLDALLERGNGEIGEDRITSASLGEESDLVQKALFSLPEDYRAVLNLRLRGLNYKEISLALNISLDTVKARLKRSRQSLREKFGHFLSNQNV